MAARPMTCLDCHQHFHPRLDGLELCEPCLAIAEQLAGSGPVRIAVLTR